MHNDMYILVVFELGDPCLILMKALIEYFDLTFQDHDCMLRWELDELVGTLLVNYNHGYLYLDTVHSLTQQICVIASTH